MVIQSKYREISPPGGSNLAGHYHKHAFSAFVYPKPGARRTEKEELRTTVMHPESQHKASVFYTSAKEGNQPSRLKKQVDKFVKEEAAKPASIWAQAKATHEAEEQIRAEKKRTGELPPTPPPRPIEGPEGGRTWCPHPSLLRGVCRLNKPRALDWGIDLTHAPGWDCPFWDAPRHRFDSVAAQPEARPVTPTRSLRWRTDDDWNNNEMHPAWKITQSLPKTNSMVELTRVKKDPTSVL